MLERGLAFIAPPNRHLLVNADGSLSLTQTELVHFVRPSADLLFESVAASYKERAIARGAHRHGQRRRDGREGDQEDGRHGDRAGREDRASSAACPAPREQTGAVDFVLPLAEIAPRAAHAW